VPTAAPFADEGGMFLGEVGARFSFGQAGGGLYAVASFGDAPYHVAVTTPAAAAAAAAAAATGAVPQPAYGYQHHTPSAHLYGHAQPHHHHHHAAPPHHGYATPSHSAAPSPVPLAGGVFFPGTPFFVVHPQPHAQQGQTRYGAGAAATSGSEGGAHAGDQRRRMSSPFGGPLMVPQPDVVDAAAYGPTLDLDDSLLHSSMHYVSTYTGPLNTSADSVASATSLASASGARGARAASGSRSGAAAGDAAAFFGVAAAAAGAAAAAAAAAAARSSTPYGAVV